MKDFLTIEDMLKANHQLTKIPLSTPAIWWVDDNREPQIAMRIGHPANGAWRFGRGSVQYSALILANRIGDAYIHELIEKPDPMVDTVSEFTDTTPTPDDELHTWKLSPGPIMVPPEPQPLEIKLTDDTIRSLGGAIEDAIENALTNHYRRTGN